MQTDTSIMLRTFILGRQPNLDSREPVCQDGAVISLAFLFNPKILVDLVHLAFL